MVEVLPIIHNPQERIKVFMEQFGREYKDPSVIMKELKTEFKKLETMINSGEKDSESLSLKLADIVYGLSYYANSKGLDIDSGFTKMMDKCYNRDKK